MPGFKGRVAVVFICLSKKKKKWVLNSALTLTGKTKKKRNDNDKREWEYKIFKIYLFIHI